jgi:hypothetical protein
MITLDPLEKAIFRAQSDAVVKEMIEFRDAHRKDIAVMGFLDAAMLMLSLGRRVNKGDCRYMLEVTFFMALTVGRMLERGELVETEDVN